MSIVIKHVWISLMLVSTAIKCLCNAISNLRCLFMQLFFIHIKIVSMFHAIISLYYNQLIQALGSKCFFISSKYMNEYNIQYFRIQSLPTKSVASFFLLRQACMYNLSQLVASFHWNRRAYTTTILPLEQMDSDWIPFPTKSVSFWRLIYCFPNGL